MPAGVNVRTVVHKYDGVPAVVHSGAIYNSSMAARRVSTFTLESKAVAAGHSAHWFADMAFWCARSDPGRTYR